MNRFVAAAQTVTYGLSACARTRHATLGSVGVFIAGLLTGTVLGAFVASLFAVNARQRGREDAEELADRLEQDEKLERDFSG